MTTERTPSTTIPSTVAHDSTDGSAEWCDDCHGYTHMPWCPAYTEQHPLTEPSQCDIDNGGQCEKCLAEWSARAASRVQQSAAAIRARRAALLERTDIHSPTEGAIALAEAYLHTADWFHQLPNNAMQDAALQHVAGRVEGVIGEYLEQREKR